VAGRHADADGVQGPRVERVLGGGEVEAGERDLHPGSRPGTQSPDRDTSSAQRDFARCRPTALRLPCRIGLPFRSAGVGAVLLHHGGENLTTGVEAEREETVIGQCPQHRHGHLDGGHFGDGTGVVLMGTHGGFSFWLFPSLPGRRRSRHYLASEI
jgi:hypothetical protein